MKNVIRQWLNGDQQSSKGLEIIKEIDIVYHDFIISSGSTESLIFDFLLKAYKGEQLPENVAPVPVVQSNQQDQSNDAYIEAQINAKRLFKEMSNVRAVLFSKCTITPKRWENEAQYVKERGKLVIELIKLAHEVDEAYDAAQFAKEHGRLPDHKTPILQSPDQIFHEIVNLRTWISKAKKKVNLSEYQKNLLPEKEKQLQELQKLHKNK